MFVREMKRVFFVFPETHQVVVAEVQLQEDLEVPVLTQKKNISDIHFSGKKCVKPHLGKKWEVVDIHNVFFSLSLRQFFPFPLGEKRRVQIFVSSFSLLAS